jgi:hypothetical protein
MEINGVDGGSEHEGGENGCPLTGSISLCYDLDTRQVSTVK